MNDPVNNIVGITLFCIASPVISPDHVYVYHELIAVATELPDAAHQESYGGLLSKLCR